MEYFRWQPAPSVPAVLLSWSAMAGIEGQAIEGFKALPRRGAEVGGALLGHRNPETGDFTVDSFEPIPVEHETGPSYIPSERDIALWRERVTQLRQASPGFIGIYRSQTRPGLLVMPDDCEMVERFLPREEGVLLLVKPLSTTECIGAFFLCDGGAVLDEAVAARQFAFRKPGVPAPAKLAKMSAWIPTSAAVFGIAMAMLLHYRQDQPQAQAAENPVPAGPPASLHLHAEPDGSNARVEWDPASTLLDGATGAILNVADGNTHKALRLTTADLRNGYVEWPTHSRAVTFGMELDRPGQPPAGESMSWVDPRYPINSSSDKANQKPSPLAIASSPAEDEKGPVPPGPRPHSETSRPLAVKTQQPGRVKRIVNGITSKASHLWPFHSAKPAPPTQ